MRILVATLLATTSLANTPNIVPLRGADSPPDWMVEWVRSIQERSIPVFSDKQNWVTDYFFPLPSDGVALSLPLDSSSSINLEVCPDGILEAAAAKAVKLSCEGRVLYRFTSLARAREFGKPYIESVTVSPLINLESTTATRFVFNVNKAPERVEGYSVSLFIEGEQKQRLSLLLQQLREAKEQEEKRQAAIKAAQEQERRREAEAKKAQQEAEERARAQVEAERKKAFNQRLKQTQSSVSYVLFSPCSVKILTKSEKLNTLKKEFKQAIDDAAATPRYMLLEALREARIKYQSLVAYVGSELKSCPSELEWFSKVSYSAKKMLEELESFYRNRSELSGSLHGLLLSLEEMNFELAWLGFIVPSCCQGTIIVDGRTVEVLVEDLRSLKAVRSYRASTGKQLVTMLIKVTNKGQQEVRVPRLSPQLNGRNVPVVNEQVMREVRWLYGIENSSQVARLKPGEHLHQAIAFEVPTISNQRLTLAQNLSFIVGKK